MQPCVEEVVVAVVYGDRRHDGGKEETSSSPWAVGTEIKKEEVRIRFETENQEERYQGGIVAHKGL